MEPFTVKLPGDLSAELEDVAHLRRETESETIRECLRRALPALKKSFIGRDLSSSKKISRTINKS